METKELGTGKGAFHWQKLVDINTTLDHSLDHSLDHYYSKLLFKGCHRVRGALEPEDAPALPTS